MTAKEKNKNSKFNGVRKLSTSGKSAKVFYWAMFALPIVQFVIFYIVVNFNSIVLAFQSYDQSTGETTFAGLANFRKFFETVSQEGSSGIWHIAIKNSLIFLLADLIIAMPLTLVFSYYIYKKFAMSRFFRLILFLPNIICSMVFVVFFENFISLGLFPDAESPLYNMDTAIWILLFFNVWITFGPKVLVYVNAMAQINPAVIEAAKVDGSSDFHQFIHIIIPQIYPTIISFVSISLAQLCVNQASAYSFFAEGADQYQVQTLGYELFMLVNKVGATKNDYAYASALGVMFTIIIAPITIIVRKLMTKHGPSED